MLSLHAIYLIDTASNRSVEGKSAYGNSPSVRPSILSPEVAAVVSERAKRPDEAELLKLYRAATTRARRVILYWARRVCGVAALPRSKVRPPSDGRRT